MKKDQKNTTNSHTLVGVKVTLFWKQKDEQLLRLHSQATAITAEVKHVVYPNGTLRLCLCLPPAAKDDQFIL